MVKAVTEVTESLDSRIAHWTEQAERFSGSVEGANVWVKKETRANHMIFDRKTPPPVSVHAFRPNRCGLYFGVGSPYNKFALYLVIQI